MNILVFNCGSSSLTFKLFEKKSDDEVEEVLAGKAHRVGVKGSKPSSIEFHYRGLDDLREIPIPDHGEAAGFVFEKLAAWGIPIDCIGHRWTHAAGHFTTAWIDKQVLDWLRILLPVFPIHHPAMIGVILRSRKTWPDLPQYVTADGAFHATIPPRAYTYPLPGEIVRKFGFRKYGFHGLSYQYIIRQTGLFLKIPLERLKIVACHLGTGGSSVVAVKGGRSIDTSMGYTGLPGLVMSTRCGDIDPMLALYFMAAYDYRADDLMELLNKKSGLLGISGFSSDIRDIIQRLASDRQARLAFDMYVYRLKKYIGSYVVALGGMDILVFTDDIGLHNWLVREKVCRHMEWCGIRMNDRANRNAVGETVSVLSAGDSNVKVLSMPTEEELVICLEGLKLMRSEKNVPAL